MLQDNQKDILRTLPSVHALLQQPQIIELIDESSLKLVSDITARVIENLRTQILSKEITEAPELLYIIDKIKKQYKKLTTPHLRSVVNGTGIVLHTNLGRAKLSKQAIEAVQNAASNFSNLEYRLTEGKRGSRYEHVEDLLIQLTGAEAALVVNNNASAVILILQEMAKEKEVIVSRGQLVEIGGSFRISEIMVRSGAHLVEVGTTNKTHPHDYENAITDQTGLLMKVHTSNYKIIGFTKEVCLKKLVEIGKTNKIPVYEDLGSGVLYDLKQHDIGDEPTVQEAVQAGADIVSFSGDKLLGGPQTGIIVGKKKYIDRLKKNQLTRSLRVDKMTLAALEATLRHYLLDEAVEKIPTLHMILMDKEELIKKSHSLFQLLHPIIEGYGECKVIDGYSEIGGGAFPDIKLPTKLIAIKPNALLIHHFEKKMRVTSPHIIGRIADETYLLDVRTIEQSEFELIVEKIKKVIS